MKQKLTGPTVHRAATGIEVLDSSKRQVRLSFSSDTPYLRQSWFDDPWLEVLGHDQSEVDMGRLDGGACPLLWGHDSYDRDNHIGVVERAWIEGSKGYADVRLSGRSDLDDLWADVAGGIVRNVSVGYKIHERTLTRAASNGPSEYRVTRWEPVELSLVSVPADPGVGVGRSADPATRFTITTLERQEMNQPTETPVPTTAAPAAPVVNAEQIRAEAVAFERQRIADIHTAVRAAGLPPEFGERLVTENVSIDAARAQVINELAKKPTPKEPHMTPGLDVADKARAAAEAWLSHRGGETVKPEMLQDNPTRGFTLLDMARDCLVRAGVNTKGLLGRELATRAITHSTSDFPIILQNTMHKALQNAYTTSPDVWREFCRVGSLADFRPHYRYLAGSFGNLATVAENGTYTYGTVPDAERESITGATKGKLLNISRQMIINDDLGAFMDITRAMGRGAARTIEVDVFTLLASNPTMGDTGALFNSTAVTTAGGHANITSYVAPTVASFDTVRQALATQYDVGQNDFISVRPSIWLGPVALGGAARVVNESQYDVDQSSKTSFYPNKSRGLFDKIVDTPRLTGSVWYAFADPNEHAVIEVGFLNGEQAPYTEMQTGFEVDGVTWKVRLDYGVAAVGWRGGHKVV